MDLTDSGAVVGETLNGGAKVMAGYDLLGPEGKGALGERLARLPQWQRDRLLLAMSQLLGELLEQQQDHVVELIEVVERQVGENRYEYRAQAMNTLGQVVAPREWSPTRVDAVVAIGQMHEAGGGVVVATVCRRCFAELPPLEVAGSRYACRCGQVFESSRYGPGWRPLSS